MQNNSEVIARIDKWLWEVRLFKTRSIATNACRVGKVKINGQAIKASKEVKIGDEITVSLNPLNKTIKVLQIPKSRIGAQLVSNYYLDLTSEAEYLRVKAINETNSEYRKRGFGRPTKKERRIIDRLKSGDDF